MRFIRPYTKAVVMVVTIRALRHHGGAKKDELNTASADRVEKRLLQPGKHLENMKRFGMETVVAINLFPGYDEEIQYCQEFCKVYDVKAVECAVLVKAEWYDCFS